MKTWKIYLSDVPDDPIIITSDSYTRMKYQVKLYMEEWKIDAEIIKIEEVED